MGEVCFCFWTLNFFRDVIELLADPSSLIIADGHPAVSSPTLPATTNASPSDAAPNAATTEWRLSRPHEDWVLAHPVYTQEELDAIQIVERPPENMTDRLAKWMVKAARAGFDLVTGYKVRRLCPIRMPANVHADLSRHFPAL